MMSFFNYCKYIGCFLICTLHAKSFIVGMNQLKNHPKYALLTQSKNFNKGDFIVVLTMEENFSKNPIRYSRNVFGYSVYKIQIYKKEELIYEKYFRLNSFDGLKRNIVKFNKNKHNKNTDQVIDFIFTFLTSFISDPQKDPYNIEKIIKNQPTSDMIYFNENGKIKAFNLNFQDFKHLVHKDNNFDIIPSILNKYDIKIVKIERIYNHATYSYIIINNIMIKLPNKNYSKNLYRTFLKIECLYLQNNQILNADSSLFFIEFDKLAEKEISELIELKNKLISKKNSLNKN